MDPLDVLIIIGNAQLYAHIMAISLTILNFALLYIVYTEWKTIALGASVLGVIVGSYVPSLYISIQHYTYANNGPAIIWFALFTFIMLSLLIGMGLRLIPAVNKHIKRFGL